MLGLELLGNTVVGLKIGVFGLTVEAVIGLVGALGARLELETEIEKLAMSRL